MLQSGFRSAAQQQFAQVGGPDAGNLAQRGDAVDEYAMGAAFQQQILNSNDQGAISMRFQNLDADSTELPTVSSQVVTLDELSTALPVGTVYYDDVQRAVQLATRKAGFDNRFAPYSQP